MGPKAVGAAVGFLVLLQSPPDSSRHPALRLAVVAFPAMVLTRVAEKRVRATMLERRNRFQHPLPPFSRCARIHPSTSRPSFFPTARFALGIQSPTTASPHLKFSTSPLDPNQIQSCICIAKRCLGAPKFWTKNGSSIYGTCTTSG